MISATYYLAGEARERGGAGVEEHYLKSTLTKLGYEYARKHAIERTFFEYFHLGELHTYASEDAAFESFKALGIGPKPISKRVILTLREKGDF